MTGITHRAVLAAIGLVAGAILSQVALDASHAGRPPASVSTPDVPPMGWTETCEPAAIGMVCHTYPPGDDRWQPTAPLPPRLPLRLPR
jgi:hypothetical protein